MCSESGHVGASDALRRGRQLALQIGERVLQAWKLALPGTENKAQGVMVIDVTAFDWNCPKYITPRWTADEIEIIAGANS